MMLRLMLLCMSLPAVLTSRLSREVFDEFERKERLVWAGCTLGGDATFVATLVSAEVVTDWAVRLVGATSGHAVEDGEMGLGLV